MEFMCELLFHKTGWGYDVIFLLCWESYMRTTCLLKSIWIQCTWMAFGKPFTDIIIVMLIVHYQYIINLMGTSCFWLDFTWETVETRNSWSDTLSQTDLTVEVAVAVIDRCFLLFAKLMWLLLLENFKKRFRTTKLSEICY